MTSGMSGDTDNFYTLVPEQGLCLVGNDIVNLRRVNLIRRTESGTLLYYSGVAEPVALPAAAFEDIRDAVFAVDDLGDEDFEDED